MQRALPMFNVRLAVVFFFILAPLYTVSPTPVTAAGASLYLSPASGSFTVGSTFSVSILLNTGGQNINAVEVDLRFPADKLQVATSEIGPSIISLWATPPQFSNAQGVINLKGGVPSPGIRTSAGLITSISFRVVGVGQASIRFTGESKVLLDDGQGTQVLSDTRGALYALELPPPAGPFVSTPTHIDPQKWYINKNPLFIWEKEPKIQAYSYVLNDRPLDVPDEIPEGDATKIQYTDLADGVWFFHIKALGPSGWGDATHMQIRIDATSPAAFPIEIVPRARTSERQPIIYYLTTDNLSGVDHYEVKLVPVGAGATLGSLTPFFIESGSPYRPPALEEGAYDVIVRVYDKAGNTRESHKKLKIVPFIYQIVGDEGVSIRGVFVIGWPIIWTILIALILLLLYLLYYLYRRHILHDEKVRAGLIKVGHNLGHHLKTGLLKKV